MSLIIPSKIFSPTLVVAIAAIGFSVFSSPALADEFKSGTINVSATGTAKLTPDMAILNLSVIREGKTARDALSANNSAMSAVLKAMTDSGIAQRDLQTSNFNIQPRYFYPKRLKDGSQRPPKITGYVISNSLTVRVRDLSRIGEILDQSVTLGVNNGGGIRFTSDNPKAAIEDARKSAMLNAIAKAKTLTTTAGAQLGRIISISENGARPPRPRKIARMEMAMAAPASDSAVPIASGENSYSVTVNVKWEIIE